MALKLLFFILMRKLLFVSVLALACQGWSQSNCQGLFASSKVPLSIKIHNRIRKIGAITADQLFDGKSFLTVHAGENVVVMNGMVNSDQEYLDTVAPFIDLSKNTGGHLTFVPSARYLNLIIDLFRIYREHGPIDRMILIGHGSPGEISFADLALTLEFHWKYGRLFEFIPTDLFKPGAKIVIYSCSAAAGRWFAPELGTNFLTEVFGSLLKQGGEILAARRMIVGGILGTDADQQRIMTDYNDSSPLGKKLINIAMLPLIGLQVAKQVVFNLIQYLTFDWKSLAGRKTELIVIPSQTDSELDF